MWISSITSGVKRELWPSTCVLRPSLFLVVGSGAGTFFSFAMSCLPFREPHGAEQRGANESSENEFLLGGFEIVVIPQLPARGDLLHVLDAPRGREAVHLQFALQPLHVEVGHFRRHGIDPEARDFAADVDRAVVHGIAEVLAGIAEDDHASALHHEAAEGARPATNDDRAALHIDTDARADVALAHQITATYRGAEGRARVLLDHYGSGEHVLGARPADPALDADVGSVDQPAAEIAQTAFDREIETVEDADRQGMLGAGVLDHDGAEALTHQLAQFQIDLARGHGGGVELGALLEIDLKGLWIGEALLLLGSEEALLVATGELLGVHPQVGRSRRRDCHDVSRSLMTLKDDQLFRHTRTSPSYGSKVSISWGKMLRIATSSEASAMKRSLS